MVIHTGDGTTRASYPGGDVALVMDMTLPPTEAEPCSLKRCDCDVSSGLSLNQDGTLLAIWCRHAICLWKRPNSASLDFKQIHVIEPDQLEDDDSAQSGDFVYTVLLSAAGSVMVYIGGSSEHPTAHVCRDGKEVLKFALPERQYDRWGLSPNGRLFLEQMESLKRVSIHTLSSGTILQAVDSRASIDAHAFSPDSRLLALRSADKIDVYSVDEATGLLLLSSISLHPPTQNFGMRFLTFSANGDWLACTGRQLKNTFWSVRDPARPTLEFEFPLCQHAPFFLI